MKLIDEVREVVDGRPRRRRPTTTSRDVGVLQEDIHDDVAEFIYKRLKRRPMILPVVVEV